MNIASNLATATESLIKAAVPDASRQARSLMTFVLDQPYSFLLAHPEYDLTDPEQEAYDLAVSRRTQREPLQYITGRQEFWGLEFKLVRGVLVPRPETEVLVESAISFLTGVEHPRFCDLGVGSGSISVSILSSVPSATAVATDLSSVAIDLASDNARTHGVADRLDLVRSDLFAEVHGTFDAIVSNPPYIPSAEIATLEVEVRGFEDHRALDGGPDGLDVIRRLAACAPEYLRSAGRLFIEIGQGQGEVVGNLFDSKIWGEPVFIEDLQGISRVVSVPRL